MTTFLSLLPERNRIRDFSPDCLLLSWAYPDAVAGTMLARLLGLPAIIKIHGSDINMHLLRAFRARQILWAMRRAHQIVSVSKALATRLVDAGIDEDKIQVIYNGVDKELFKPQPRQAASQKLGITSDRRIVLFVGNLKREKGCLDLLEAFAAISGKSIEVDLYFIGTGREAQFLRDRAEHLGLQSRVLFLGSLGHEQLALWMNAASIVSLPSYNEGVPNVLLESMACGTPVVATAVGGIPEVVPSQAGILVAPGDVGGLADALSRALDTEWNEEQIVNSVEKFNWDRNTLQLYESIDCAASEHNEAII